MRKIGKLIDKINEQYQSGIISMEEAISKLAPIAKTLNGRRKGDVKVFSAGRLLK